jgi:hypothetical protein
MLLHPPPYGARAGPTGADDAGRVGRAVELRQLQVLERAVPTLFQAPTTCGRVSTRK